MKLAILIARGGSKRIPRKNVRLFAGKPILAYSIRAALDSGCFDRVMVSTDDDEIARVAQDFGAQVPFRRSAATATDHATTADVLLEVVLAYQALGESPDIACCLYATAPFITPEVLRLGLDTLLESPAVPSVFPVVRFSFPIQRALRVDKGNLSFFQPQYASVRSQDLEPAYHDAGQFYWFRVDPFLKAGVLWQPGTKAIELPESQVQDIDSEEDWAIAEIKYRFLQEKRQGQSCIERL